MADIDELDELGARRGGERGAAVGRDQLVEVALGDHQRAAHPRHEVVDLRAVQAGRLERERQRLRRRLEGPVDRVLELLGRVRLGVAAVEEELEVAAEVLVPVVTIRLGPALVLGQLGVEGVPGAFRHRGRDRQRRRHEDRAAHPLGMVGAQQQRGRRRRAVAHDNGVRDARRVEHRERVLRGQAGAVLLGALGTVRQAAATRVERDDTEMAGEIGDLQLPEVRVDDRPRRQQQDRLLAVAEDLIGDADTTDVGEGTLVREEGTVRRLGGVRRDHD